MLTRAMPCASIKPLAQTSRLDLNGPLAPATSPAISSTRLTSASPRSARQKIVERLARGDFARGDMRHRIEAGAAQRGRGLDVVAIIVAGQEGDGDVGARRQNCRAAPAADARARRSRPRPTPAAQRVRMTDRDQAAVTASSSSRRRAAARNHIGLVVEPEAAMLLQHPVGGLEIAAVAHHFRQPDRPRSARHRSRRSRPRTASRFRSARETSSGSVCM